MDSKKHATYSLSASRSKGFLRKFLLTESYKTSNLLGVFFDKLPDRVDLRETGFVGEAKDQGPLEVSIGMALVKGCLEFLAKKEYQMDHELSAFYVYKKDRSSLFPSLRNTSSSFLDAVEVLKNQGCPPGRLDYSYQNTIIDYESFDWNIVSVAMKIKQCFHLGSVREVKHCLSAGYPVASLLEVYPSMFDVMVYRDGFIKVPEQSETPMGTHAITIIGFDEGRQSFIVKNSWSKSWGDYGFGYLPYQAFKIMNVESYSLRL